MKAVVIRKPLVDIQWDLVLIVIISLIRPTATAAVASQDTVSLYTSDDKVSILTSHNFSSTVYQSKTAWLVEFYASWCGHCQSYANTYREVAIDAWGWKTIVRIGAINCYADGNNDLCEQHRIVSFPTLRLIEPEVSMNNSKLIGLSANDAQGVERELIKKLADLQRNDKNWPLFIPINQGSFEEIYRRVPSTIKLILVIVEYPDDFTGRQIILDFSKYYEQLAIIRTTTDKRFWLKFQINTTDIPALFALHLNRTIEKVYTKQHASENIGHRNLLNYAIRSYIHKTQMIDNFDDSDLEEMIRSKRALKNADLKRKLDAENDDNDNTLNKVQDEIDIKINMVDFETALSYMFRREVPRIQEIRGEVYDALMHWLEVLIKYFPGRTPIMNYLKQLLSRLNEKSNGLTGEEFREFANTNTSYSFLPNNQYRYLYCSGSAPHFRGYPCVLWTLFHTLTISQIESELEQVNTMEIPSAIKHFIKYFFGCRHCSENFMKETKDIEKLDRKNKYAAIVYLWRIHNRVNKRLHGDITEDPKHPKMPFPPESLCKNCRKLNENEDDGFDLSHTMNFLLRYYSKDNIDFSAVESMSINQHAKQNPTHRSARELNADPYPMIEIDSESKYNFGLIGRLVSTLLHSPFYFFLLIVIVLIFVRRRYFKGKRKRYTL